MKDKEESVILYLASRNKHKCQEIEAMGPAGIMIRPCIELNPSISWEETARTYLENARIKARKVREFTAERVIADDSGLEVTALDRAPGVFSSSYGGIEGDHERNTQRLLADLADVPLARRKARFVCLILYVDIQGKEWTFNGYLPGLIGLKPQGRGGFGYDPIFIPEGFESSLAQLSTDLKNRLSHRGQATQAWLEHLQGELRREPNQRRDSPSAT